MQFQQDYPQPCPQQYPQQYPMVIHMQAAVHNVGEIWGDIAEQEKYGQRMVCMSCVSGVIWLFMFGIFVTAPDTQDWFQTVLSQVFFVCLGALLSCGPALCAVAVKKGYKGLLRYFCCCSSLLLLLHLFMLLIYASLLIYTLSFRSMPLDCRPEYCAAADEALWFTKGDGEVEYGAVPWQKLNMDCYAPALWPGYVQASESQWSAETVAEVADRDAAARTIVSAQKQYPPADRCPVVFTFLKCDFEKVPPFLKGVPTFQQVLQNCELDQDTLDLYYSMVNYRWPVALPLAGMFVHSTMFLLFCCGCRAGRKLRKQDDGGIELAMLQR